MKIPIVCVYKGSRKNSKIHIEVFNNILVDDIISTTKRKPLIPKDSQILELGVGTGFLEKYKKKSKL